MKCIAVVISVIAILVQAKIDENAKDLFERLHSECQADPATKVTDAVLEASKKGDIDVEAIGPHTLCMNTKLGMQRPNGDVDKDELRAAITKIVVADDAKLDEIATDCGKRDGETANEAAVNLYLCFAKHTELHHGEHGLESD
ncbi:hypothetical protein JTB14_019079 [Gonioctena quinquepunctata]|nr:hypothetical protein JTB14_019079 [Gonioctena quinquepunctata]